MGKLFRCYNCDGPGGIPGKDFEADRPECPDCGADPPTVTERAVIHFDPPSGIRNRGANDAACSPGIRVGSGQQIHMTGVPSAVTCPACRATRLWRDAAAAAGVPTIPAELDVPVTLDPATLTVTRPGEGTGDGS